MPSLLDAVASIDPSIFSVVESLDLPARQERRLPVPPRFLLGGLGDWLRKGLAQDGALWSHQSIALEAIAEAKSVVLSTDTASGKSLVFHAAAFEELQRNPDARFIVYYPQIALVNDQLVHWRHAAQAAGFSADTVGQIYGGVREADRTGILHSARVVLMTPDVCQAWLLRNISRPEIQSFLKQLAMVVLDEAHVFEGVMGSNAALLLRRLAIARRCAKADRGSDKLRVLAASATISNPEEHLHALFGLNFETVGADCDGSPSFAKKLLHIGADDEREATIRILKHLLERSDYGTFIVFADSRQGVERIARDLEHDGVRPYRSGYEHHDRRAIEDALRNGELRGVISTSALELGINIPHFMFGLNVGVPHSRKALRQRVGRVGRSQPGIFGIVADRFSFARMGQTLADYWGGSVEPSCLYIDNRFIQFAHGRCLTEELESVGRRNMSLPAADWPKDFESVYAICQPGAARPTEFDNINQIGGDDPHRNYPLRNVGETSYVLADGADKVGEIALHQAIREAYPGAIYLHLARPYRVYEWRSTVFDRAIRIGKSKFPSVTKAISRTWVNAAVESDGIVDGHYVANGEDFLCECQLQITERVEGYTENGKRKLYKDLTDPAMKSKMREFRTTGVVIRAGQDWFRAPEMKRRFAAALHELVLREHSIAPQDLGVAYTNVSLLQGNRRIAVSDAVVLFDSTYGSLRLSEPAFTNAPLIFDRLRRAVMMLDGNEEAPVSIDFLEKLLSWYTDLEPTEIVAPASLTAEGLLRIYRPGSTVARRGYNSGTPVDTRIVEPMLMEGAGGPELCYRVKDLGSGRELNLAQTAIICVGDDWSEVLWNPETGAYVEEEDPLAAHVGA